MKNPFLKTPLILNIVVLIISGIISWFTLLFGFAHLFEGIGQIISGSVPNIPIEESILGWILITTLCGFGIGALIVAIAAIKGILSNVGKANH